MGPIGVGGGGNGAGPFDLCGAARGDNGTSGGAGECRSSRESTIGHNRVESVGDGTSST